MTKRSGTSVKAKRVGETYQLAHAAWRAGAVRDFYYGERGPGDPTIVWMLDGLEYPQGAAGEVAEVVRRALARHGIASVEFGDAWCGFRELVVTFTDGARMVQRYTGSGLEVVEVAA